MQTPFGKMNPASITPFLAALRRLGPTLLLGVALAGCASRGGREASVRIQTEPPVVRGARLLGAYAAWAGTLAPVGGLAVGSLSALAYDATSGRWAGASDEIRQPRLVWFELTLGAEVSVRPASVLQISVGDGVPADTLTALDMEGLAFFPDGSFAISHEGHIDRAGVGRQPRVLLTTRQGVITQVLRPRDHFTIDPADRTHGVRHNLGLESLTRTPDGRLVSGIEQPLAQDGPVSNRLRGGRIRLVEFTAASGTWTTGREWAYSLDPTPVVAGYDASCEDGENGLSELLALTETRFLAVERACLLGASGSPAFNPVRLYEVSVAGADDVSGLASLAGRTPVAATKRLVVDLTTWRDQLPPALATGTNVEGLSFGPPGPSGERTVMLVSDDNFRATQTTAFIWIALP